MPMSVQSGDKVRVIGGPYRGWEGEVLRVEEDRERVTVVIPVFAKPTANSGRRSSSQSSDASPPTTDIVATCERDNHRMTLVALRTGRFHDRDEQRTYSPVSVQTMYHLLS